jgi:hypothetical protein
MKEIKIGDLFISKNEIFKVTHIFSSNDKRIYTCDAWIKCEGFVDNSDYDLFTDQDVEDLCFEIYSPK